MCVFVCVCVSDDVNAIHEPARKKRWSHGHGLCIRTAVFWVWPCAWTQAFMARLTALPSTAQAISAFTLQDRMLCVSLIRGLGHHIFLPNSSLNEQSDQLEVTRPSAKDAIPGRVSDCALNLSCACFKSSKASFHSVPGRHSPKVGHRAKAG